MEATQVIHRPRLDTVIMVEDTIKSMDYYPTKNQLWRALPKMVMWQTFNVILDYLVSSNKIIITKDKKITWVAIDNKKLRKLFETSVDWRGRK